MLVSCLTSSGGQLVGVAVTEICVLVPPPVEPCVHAPEFCIDSCDVQVAVTALPQSPGWSPLPVHVPPIAMEAS